MRFPSVKGPVVYLITNAVNDRIYVGSCTHLGRRVASYRWSVQTNPRPTTSVIINAMRKHGFGAFTCRVLQHVNDGKRLKAYEQFWIDSLHPFGERGYNVARLAQVHEGWSPKHREEVSATRRAIALRYGEDTRIRSSRPVHQIDKDALRVIATFSSAIAADGALGLSTNSVNKVCRDVCARPSAGGYYWAYADVYETQDFKAPDPEVGKRRMVAFGIRPVAQLDEQGVTVKVWESGFAAARAMRVHCGTISKACQLGKRCKGFKWRHVTDEATINLMRQRVLEGAQQL